MASQQVFEGRDGNDNSSEEDDDDIGHSESFVDIADILAGEKALQLANNVNESQKQTNTAVDTEEERKNDSCEDEFFEVPKEQRERRKRSSTDPGKWK